MLHLDLTSHVTELDAFLLFFGNKPHCKRNKVIWPSGRSDVQFQPGLIFSKQVVPKMVQGRSLPNQHIHDCYILSKNWLYVAIV